MQLKKSLHGVFSKKQIVLPPRVRTLMSEMRVFDKYMSYIWGEEIHWNTKSVAIIRESENKRGRGKCP